MSIRVSGDSLIDINNISEIKIMPKLRDDQNVKIIIRESFSMLSNYFFGPRIPYSVARRCDVTTSQLDSAFGATLNCAPEGGLAPDSLA